MIDTSSWKEFRVGELFSCETTLGIPSKNDLEDGNINYITRSAIDNGFSGICGNEDHKNKGNCITIGAEGFVAFWQSDDFVAGNKVYALRHHNMNEINGLFVCSALNALSNRYSFADARVLDKIKVEIIKLPATSEGQPDWDYMESYMKAVMEESEKSLENLRKADDTKHLIDVSRWGEFKLSDLFTKRTMKGYPKKAEVYDENENGYHIYGQNIGWQYPYKVLMDEQYLHKVEPDKPILAYASSVGEIGLINESFYRSGDNGAFQGLFPIGYHPNLLQMQFVLSILKKEFEKFRYDTSMQNTMDITFKLPITSTGEPDWQYMEDYMRRIMDKSEQIISDLQIGA